MVVPGLYGFVSACKWITRMTLTTYAEQEAYWTKQDWATDAPIKISSRIDTPKPLSTIDAGRTVIGGDRLGPAPGRHRQGRGARRRRRRGSRPGSGPSAGNDYWRQWYLPVDRRARPAPRSPSARSTARATSQTAVRATPFPEGSSGVQEIVVNVA